MTETGLAFAPLDIIAHLSTIHKAREKLIVLIFGDKGFIQAIHCVQLMLIFFNLRLLCDL